MNPGTKIKELRTLAKMSQEELGRRVGVQRAAIQKYEKGTVENIPIKTIEQIALVFDVSPTYIVGWDNHPTNPLALEVKILQGVARFFGKGAIDLLEIYHILNKEGKSKLIGYANDLSKLYDKDL